jgi:hypothetical protein
MENGDYSFWSSVADGGTTDFSSVFGTRGYEGSCDFPSAVYYKQQLKLYPDAKVILTLRDPEKW